MYGKIENNILVQKQPYPQEGFIRIPADAVCGQIMKGKDFIDPPIIDTRDYKEKRELELHHLDNEGMDAIRKEIAAIRAGNPETPEYQIYREKVETVKRKYPKQ